MGRQFLRAATTGLSAIWLMASPGCARHRATPPPPPPTKPATTTQPMSLFTNEPGGIQLTLPSQWQKRPSNDYVLMLAPIGAKSNEQGSISLDIPQLPTHIRGLIPIGSVKSGYLDDLRH